MYIDASDHACPHLREQMAMETRPAPVAPASSAGCPFGAGRAAAEPLHLAATNAGAGGWWAYCAQAGSAEARP